MTSKPSPSVAPSGVPSGGGGKYVAVAVILLGLIGAAVVWKMSQKPPVPTVIYVDAAAPPPTIAARNPDDDIPLPPPASDAGSEDAGKKVVASTGGGNNQCDAKKCSGVSSSELETALQFRVKQAHRCYDNALAQDATLRGKITVNVRIGSTGQVCSAGVASNEMGSQTVAQCVAGYFRGANFPAPRGGCADVNIPINFVPRQ